MHQEFHYYKEQKVLRQQLCQDIFEYLCRCDCSIFRHTSELFMMAVMMEQLKFHAKL